MRIRDMPNFQLPETEIRANLTISIVCAYVRNNAAAPRELPNLIASVHSALTGLSEPAAAACERPPRRSPAEVRSSITPDALVSFINGKAYALLKRHLASHGLTPSAYRERYGLPDDYPMVAPRYSKRRSTLARATMLGHR
ncbi:MULTISPECIES: MucR family transcriptional regulator [Methylobacterium]|uniref:MucR family transcriptional regulator n=2 Tax=Methylobacterium TaxID=407 RepID=UPI0030B8760A